MHCLPMDVLLLRIRCCYICLPVCYLATLWANPLHYVETQYACVCVWVWLSAFQRLNNIWDGSASTELLINICVKVSSVLTLGKKLNMNSKRVDNHSEHSYQILFSRFIISKSTLNRNKLVLFVGCELRLSSLGSPPNNGPTVPAQWMVWSIQCNENWQGNRITRRQPAPVSSGPQVPRDLSWVEAQPPRYEPAITCLIHSTAQRT
jgi:hypothetical protein